MKRLTAILLFAATLTLGSPLSAAEVYIRTGPPAPQSVAIIGTRPGPGYVWTGGYWAWRGGRYVWVPGSLAQAPTGWCRLGCATLRPSSWRIRVHRRYVALTGLGPSRILEPPARPMPIKLRR